VAGTGLHIKPVKLKEEKDVHWIHLAQDRVQFWVLVNTVMKLNHTTLMSNISIL
jgi:hypothetical protein